MLSEQAIKTSQIVNILPVVIAPQKPVYSIIVPVHNEEAALPKLYQRVSAVMNSLDESWELIMVDDGSSDRSAAIMLTLNELDDRVKGISFSRNFGFQMAATAGLDHAQGEAVILIDADLQDPPEVIPEMIKKWRQGYEVVYGVRGKREGETLFKKATAAAFYRLIRRITNVDIPLDSGDFRLMDRRVVEAIRQMPEKHRFLRGMVSWVGFRQTGVVYERQARFAGQTKFTLHKMVNFALDAITSFSMLPLRMASITGMFLVAISLITGAAAMGLALAGTIMLPMAQILMLIVMVFVGGIQLTFLGIVGDYVGRMYDELKGRPPYLIHEQWGFE